MHRQTITPKPAAPSWDHLLPVQAPHSESPQVAAKREVRGEVRSSGSETVARWNADWDWWRSTSTSTSAVARWVERHLCLAGLSSMDEVLDACGNDRTVAQEVADERLAAVVQEARCGDREAARLTLHRVFPGLIHQAAKRARSHRMPLDAILEELMSAAWVVITEFPLERRPVKIAVNIIKDADYQVFGYVPTSVRRTVPMAPEDLPHGCTYGSVQIDEWQEPIGIIPPLLFEAMANGFSRADAQLLAKLLVFHLPALEVAREAGVTDRWIRKLKERALHRLAEYVDDPAAVNATSSRDGGGLAGEVGE